MSSAPSSETPRPITDHFQPGYRPVPFLPMSRDECVALGWDACDVVLVTGDAYIDHPSFGMALVGRLLEALGLKVGIISQPDWRSAEPFRALGQPRLFFGITAGNMDSMVNHYTSDRKIRHDDAYTPDGAAGCRPDRALTVYAQRAREAFPGVPVVIGGIEASLRRIAHYDYWSDKVRRSVLPDAKADLLLYGNAERALVALAVQMMAGTPIGAIRDLRGSAFMVPCDWLPDPGWQEVDSRLLDRPGPVAAHPDPYAMSESGGVSAQASAAGSAEPGAAVVTVLSAAERRARRQAARAQTVIRLPAFETVNHDPVAYAHASRLLHLESNPGNARALRQAHGEGAGRRDVWLNPPPIPLTTAEMDAIYDLPYRRAPHPSYGTARIPAWEMIRFSISIMRGCFGGCTFCSITEHEGRIIQSRSQASVIREIEAVRDRTEGFAGHITDLGGPTANMYRLACKDRTIESACRRLSCVYPDICPNLDTDHAPLIDLYRAARSVPGVKRVTIGSGLRYDLAVRSPEYVRELATHHVSGLLKIAPEHTEDAPLSKMMKPGIGTFERFRALFDRYSREAGKKQHLVPYFIAAHPGTRDEDMVALALWLKANKLRPDQVQTFLPTPMALATTMYHSERNPLRGGLDRPDAERVTTARSGRSRRLHKALLRYHDPANWPLIREALLAMGRRDLIGNRPHQLVPWQDAVPHGRSDRARRESPANATVRGAAATRRASRRR